MMSGMLLSWKMRQSAVCVSIHSHGTSSAEYVVNVASLSPAENRLTNPLTYRSPAGVKMRMVAR